MRHHHEREDGKGYPDGLSGKEIPIGAKIIGVCDAVDAMLSDRPYRKALMLSVVLDQLQEHTHAQFDERVVRALVQSDILAEHAKAMRVQREENSTTGTVDERTSRVTPLPIPVLMATRPPRLRKYS